MHRTFSGYHHYCLKISTFLLDITLLMFAGLQMHWDFASLSLHHITPAGTNWRPTAYRHITRLHLSDPRPHLLPSPREGAADQGKGRKGGRSEREKCICVPQDWFLSVWIRKWECGSRRGTAETSLHSVPVCVCVCVPCWTEVSYMWRSQLQASGNQGWCSKSLKCQRQLCCDLLYECSVCLCESLGTFDD